MLIYAEGVPYPLELAQSYQRACFSHGVQEPLPNLKYVVPPISALLKKSPLGKNPIKTFFFIESRIYTNANSELF